MSKVKQESFNKGDYIDEFPQLGASPPKNTKPLTSASKPTAPAPSQTIQKKPVEAPKKK